LIGGGIIGLINRLYFLAAFVIFFFNVNNAYPQSFEEESDFINYLFSLKEYEEASFFAESISKKYTGVGRMDSINFFLGKAGYEMKNVENSVRGFLKVSSNSSFYAQSQFFAGFQLAYLGKLDTAETVFDHLSTSDSLIKATQAIELAGVSLLKREFDSFEQYSAEFDGTFYQLKASEDGLKRYSQDLNNFKAKSPFLAGLFSTVIPGTGKMYAGKLGQGIGNLLVTGLFALETLESYRKDGPGSARFIIFGSICSIFYIGNIYGSVYSIKIRRDEFNEKINNAILVDMHLPLRLLFR
jgi:hypothetical protein